MYGKCTEEESSRLRLDTYLMETITSGSTANFSYGTYPSLTEINPYNGEPFSRMTYQGPGLSSYWTKEVERVVDTIKRPEEDMSDFNKFVAKAARGLSDEQLDDLYDVMKEKDWQMRVCVLMLTKLLKDGATFEGFGYEREE